MAEEQNDKIEPTAQSLKANTTAQDDINTAGQRRINLIWELTQAFIAVSVICITLFADVYITVIALTKEKEMTITQLIGVTNLTALAMLVVGFYFSRTNHQAIGGIGNKASDSQKYVGR